MFNIPLLFVFTLNCFHMFSLFLDTLNIVVLSLAYSSLLWVHNFLPNMYLHFSLPFIFLSLFSSFCFWQSTPYPWVIDPIPNKDATHGVVDAFQSQYSWIFARFLFVGSVGLRSTCTNKEIPRIRIHGGHGNAFAELFFIFFLLSGDYYIYITLHIPCFRPSR